LPHSHVSVAWTFRWPENKLATPTVPTIIVLYIFCTHNRLPSQTTTKTIHTPLHILDVLHPPHSNGYILTYTLVKITHQDTTHTTHTTHTTYRTHHICTLLQGTSRAVQIYQHIEGWNTKVSKDAIWWSMQLEQYGERYSIKLFLYFMDFK
jgi:hypothetical protein